MRKKLYYPSSHIITGLHTIGKEWMFTDGTEYKGFYHTYSDGTVMTGAVYSVTTSETLIPYIDAISQPDNREYNSLLKKVEQYTAPIYHYTIPTMDDFKNGFIKRYFVRRRNFFTYSDVLEISEKQFNTLNTPNTGIDGNLYIGVSLDWKLTGPLHDSKDNHNIVYGVYDTNKRIASLKDVNLKGLKQYLTDYTELTVYSKYVSNDIKKMFGN